METKHTNLNDESVVSRLCNNMYAQSLRFGRTKGGSFSDIDEPKWAHSGRDACNYVMGGRFERQEARNGVARVTGMVSSWQVNTLWQIGPDATPNELTDLAVDSGWTPSWSSTGMAIRLDGPIPDVPSVEGLTISAADDDQSLLQWSRVYFSEAPKEYVDSFSDIILELGYGDDLSWTYYVGYMDDQPVASSMMFVAAGVAGLYYIATLPEYRRRGIGTAITNYSLQQAKLKGHDIVTLQATDMGLPVYRSLGFEECCRVTTLRMIP